MTATDGDVFVGHGRMKPGVLEKEKFYHHLLSQRETQRTHHMHIHARHPTHTLTHTVSRGDETGRQSEFKN